MFSWMKSRGGRFCVSFGRMFSYLYADWYVDRNSSIDLYFDLRLFGALGSLRVSNALSCPFSLRKLSWHVSQLWSVCVGWSMS